MTEQTNHNFSEAPASWNIKYRIKGFDEMITLRGNSYAEIAPQADKAREWVHQHTAPGVSATADAVNTDDNLPTPDPLRADFERFAQTDPKPKQQPGDVTESFEAEELTVSVTDGQTYTKIKGGQYTKFGVTVWPEVLAQAGINKQLDPAKSPFSLRGYTAYFNRKEDGKPGKVVKLVKAQA